MRMIPTLVLIALVFSPATLFAGKVELTTYYPAPYGEYENLEVSDKLKVPVVTAASPAKTINNTSVGEIWVEG